MCVFEGTPVFDDVRILRVKELGTYVVCFVKKHVQCSVIKTFGEISSMSILKIYERYGCFKKGRKDVDDDEKTGHSITSMNIKEVNRG